MNKMNKFMIACFALFLIGSVVFADDVVYDANTYPFASGTKAMAADVNAAFDEVEASVNDNDNRIIALETETADMAHKDSTLQTSLNADLLDGQTGSFYQSASNITAGTLSPSRFSAYSDLSAEGYLANASGDIARNNGAIQATLNADLLDGYTSSSFVLSTTRTGYVSVSANAAVPQYSTTATSQGNAGGGVGRYTTSGGLSYLIAPIQIPHGATITSFIYKVYDNTPIHYSRAYLYTSVTGSSVVTVASSSAGASSAMQTITSGTLNYVVNNSNNSYFIYFGVNGIAGSSLVPIAAIVQYTYVP